jgi:hypothetical protein
MAWTNLIFAFGTTLTASKMNALQNNFTALAVDDTGSPQWSGRADKYVVFSANGHIQDSVGITSITHGATGQYNLQLTGTFSVGTLVYSANAYFRSVPTTLSGFTSNVAYSDVSVRVLRGANAVLADSGTYQMGFRAGNKDSTAAEDVYQGTVIFLEHTA